MCVCVCVCVCKCMKVNVRVCVCVIVQGFSKWAPLGAATHAKGCRGMVQGLIRLLIQWITDYPPKSVVIFFVIVDPKMIRPVTQKP